MRKHMGFLARHCRVCCKGSGRHYYKCCQYVPLMECLGVDLSGDEAEIHPESFCNSCYLTAKRLLSRSDANSLHSPAQWYPHNETICDVCDVKCKGGRPKKSSKSWTSIIRQLVYQICCLESSIFHSFTSVG